MAEATKITTLDNGPFLVTGPVLMTDAEGNQFHHNFGSIPRLTRVGFTIMCYHI